MCEEQEIKANLIRLIKSQDVHDLELAIQLNIGLKIMDWKQVYFMAHIITPVFIEWECNWKHKNIITPKNNIEKLQLAVFLFRTLLDKAWYISLPSANHNISC